MYYVRDEVFMCKFLLLFIFSSQLAWSNSFKTILTKHCLECHGDKKTKGDVNLTSLNSKESFYIYYDMLKNVHTQVKGGQMPPPEDSSMTDSERKYLVDYLESVFNKLENTATNQVGPTRVRRLTSYEYDNTVKSVTGLDLNLARNFPTDGGGGEGFSNDAAILGVSPLQFEKYLEAAEEISSYSLFDLKKGFYFSQSQSIPATKKDSIDKIEKQIDVLLAKLYPKDFSIEKYLPKLMIAVNLYNKDRRNPALFASLSKEYKINKFFFKRGIDYFSTSYGKGIIERDAIKPWFGLKQLKYDEAKAKELSAKFVEDYKAALLQIDEVKDIKKKSYQDFKNNIKEIFTFTEQELLTLIDKSKIAEYQKLKMTLDFFEKGMKSKHRGVFAKQIIPHIRDLMYRAHRMPHDDKEVLEMTKDFITATADFGMPVAARMFTIRTFASMKFIFRHERKNGKATKITDYELANRLSYFIWSMPPDEELLKLASENKLSTPGNLEKQVKRLLTDKKSSALAMHFGSQWLNFGEIREYETPSKEKFPEFNKELAEDMFKESAICFEYIVKNDRSVLEIIDADYTFLNGRLKNHYGLGGGSSGFTKVSLKDKKRGGITGHASILTLTSYPMRTSPVLRGNWILNSLLGTPSPPPPPNVPALPEEEKVTKELSLKQQLEQHRKIPRCNGCHQRIDPIGFPLENYDPIGRWRNEYSGAPVDSTGELKSGKKISGQEGLKKYLLKNKDLFLKNMSRKMLGYALGRKVYYYDYFLINKMVESAQKNDYRFSALVWNVVNSYQFQHKN